MDIQESVARHEKSIKALRMLQQLQDLTPRHETEMVMQQFVLKAGTDGAARALNQMGMRVPGRTKSGPRRYVPIDITQVVADEASYKGVDERLAYVVKGLRLMKSHRKRWSIKLELISDGYFDLF